VPGDTHQDLHAEMVGQVYSALIRGGISIQNAGSVFGLRHQYGNINMRPDITIRGPVSMAVIEIEVTHRSTRAWGRHAENVFQDPHVTLVAVLNIHARRVDGSFAARLVAWVIPPGAPIEVYYLHDFGTGGMIQQVANIWRKDMSNDGDPNTAVPPNAGFITPPNRDLRAPREDAVLHATDFLRTSNGNNNTLQEEVERAVGRDPNFFRIDLSRILVAVHITLPLNDRGVDHDEEVDPN
jgi:hypothetical protein